MPGNGSEYPSFRVPLSRVVIAPNERLTSFLLEVTEDRIGIIRDIADLLGGLGVNIHHISASVEGGRGGIYLVVSLPRQGEISAESLREKLSRIEGIGNVVFQPCEIEGLLIDELNFPLMRYDDRVFTLTRRAWSSLRSNLTGLVGPQAYFAIIFRLGLEIGKGFAETYLEIASRAGIGDPMEVIRFVMTKMLAAAGWAKASLEESERGLRIILKDNLEAEASGKSDGPSCFFTKGVLAGAMSRILRTPVEVNEAKCQAAGDDHCEFTISF